MTDHTQHPLYTVSCGPEPRWLRAGAHVIALDTVGYLRLVGPNVVDGSPMVSVRSASCNLAVIEPVHECELFADFASALAAADRYRAELDRAKESGGGA